MTALSTLYKFNICQSLDPAFINISVDFLCVVLNFKYNHKNDALFSVVSKQQFCFQCIFCRAVLNNLSLKLLYFTVVQCQTYSVAGKCVLGRKHIL